MYEADFAMFDDAMGEHLSDACRGVLVPSRHRIMPCREHAGLVKRFSTTFSRTQMQISCATMKTLAYGEWDFFTQTRDLTIAQSLKTQKPDLAGATDHRNETGSKDLRSNSSRPPQGA